MLTFHDFGVKRGVGGDRIASKPVKRIVPSSGVWGKEKNGQNLLELWDNVAGPTPVAFVSYPPNTVVVVKESPC